MTNLQCRRSLRGRRNRGVMLVWFALFGIAFMLLVALAGDSAWVYLSGHQLQNAADVGALAGALKVRTDVVVAHNASVTIAGANKAGGGPVQLAANLGNGAGGDVVIGFYDSGANTFTATTSSPNAVRVTARRTAGSPAGPLPLIFGQMVNINEANVSRTATAVIGGQIFAGLVVLNPTGTTVNLTGTGSVDKIRVNNGSIQVNSNSSNAISWNGNANITAGELYVTGNQTNLQGAFTIDHVGINSPPVPDPLAALPVPARGPTNPAPVGGVLQPGYYPSGLPGGNQTLATGVYTIRGGISLNGNRSINALSGVMLYLETGGITLGGNSNIRINPMTSGAYADISIFAARGNTSTIQLGGTPDIGNPGTIYAPNAHLSIQGNPTVVGSQLVVGSVAAQGTANLTINYDGRNPVQGHDVWLVQ